MKSTVQGAAGWVLTVVALGGCAAGGGAGPGTPGAAGTEGTPAEAFEPPRVYEVPLDAPRQETEPGFIEVQGSATVTVPSDMARVTFAVETRSVTAADAAAENADLMDAVLRNLRAGAFSSLRLETFGYTLRPEYSFSDERVRTIEAYTALNNVQATVGEVDQVGGVIDAAIAAGANRISSISFDAEDTSDARARALAEAVESARAEARVIAEALGHELGPALEVRGGAERPSPRPVSYEAMSMRADAAPTPIEAGERTVTANVTVRFGLGPGFSGR